MLNTTINSRYPGSSQLLNNTASYSIAFSKLEYIYGRTNQSIRDATHLKSFKHYPVRNQNLAFVNVTLFPFTWLLPIPWLCKL